MKRKREMEMGSDIRSAIRELSMEAIKVRSESDDDHNAAHLSIKPFLFVCNWVLQVLDKIGPTMVVLRQDIDQNIQRLEKFHESDPLVYSNIVEILKKEVSEGNARKSTSCCRAFVWLARSLDFTVTLLQLLMKDSEIKMEQAVEESYNITLKPWHGWITSAAYKVALKLVPDNRTLFTILMAKDQHHDTLKEEMQTFISLLMPFLEEIHSISRTYRLDNMKAP